LWNRSEAEKRKGDIHVTTIGREFMERTKFPRMEPPDQAKGVPQPPLELPPPKEARRIALPVPRDLRLPSLDVREAIERRRTLRSYSQIPLSLEELSLLLGCTQGVKEVVPGLRTNRTVPGAGARHAFETWLLVNRVEGLDAGLYRYLAIEHGLVAQSSAPDITSQFVAACRGQDHVRTCGVMFLWTAVTYRMTWRYGERGYRYLHLDAGHVCQNLYLAAEALGCGVCALAAYNDDDVNRLLGLDGAEQFAIYLATVGKK
jgi:SagB-type dehydrogenase family enzyme